MWKQQYHKLYFGETREIQDMLKASILKMDNFPTSLYKYTKAKYGINSLKDDFIKVSTPLDANDPFEGDLLFSYDRLSSHYKKDVLVQQLDEPFFNLTDKDKFEIINDKNPLLKLIYILYDNNFELSQGFTLDEFKNKFLNMYEEFEQYHVKNFNIELKKQIIFVSLSEHNNINPMWAHYADNHKGVCIEYNMCNFEFGAEELCHPILYVKHSDFTEDINKINDDTRNKLKLLEEPFLKKSQDWSYENEWRVLTDKSRLKNSLKLSDKSDIVEKRDGMLFIKFPKPTSVFMGLKMSKDDENEIKSICNERGINVYKMKKDDSKYNLSYEQI